MRRNRYFRAVLLRLECGHRYKAVSSFYRLSEGRAASLYDHYIRRGAWCTDCRALCQPVEELGTCRA
jgi:hypothetical protein